MTARPALRDDFVIPSSAQRHSDQWPLDRGRAADDPYGAFLTLDADRARERARAMDELPERPPLGGVPIAVKDVLYRFAQG